MPEAAVVISRASLEMICERAIHAEREVAALKQHLVAHGCDDPEATDHA